MEIMKTNNVDCFDINDGKLIYKEKFATVEGIGIGRDPGSSILTKHFAQATPLLRNRCP